MATATNTIDTLDVTGKKSGTVELPAELFDVQTNVPLIHQVVVAQLAAARQGTHKTKTRGEVSGAGRKPFKQKGTGRARQGSIRAPQMTGGGVVHGPQPRDYSQRTPKKMIAAALLGALSDRARGGRIHAVEALAAGDAPKTKDAVALLNGIAPAKHFLVVLARDEELSERVVRNIETVHVLPVDQLNAYDVLVSDDIVFSKAALVTFGGAYAVLPYVGRHAVEHEAWLTAPQMLDGLGLAETTPGPLIMVVQFVGFLGGWNQPGGLSPFLAATLGAAITRVIADHTSPLPSHEGDRTTRRYRLALGCYPL